MNKVIQRKEIKQEIKHISKDLARLISLHSWTLNGRLKDEEFIKSIVPPDSVQPFMRHLALMNRNMNAASNNTIALLSILGQGKHPLEAANDA